MQQGLQGKKPVKPRGHWVLQGPNLHLAAQQQTLQGVLLLPKQPGQEKKQGLVQRALLAREKWKPLRQQLHPERNLKLRRPLEWLELQHRPLLSG